MNQVGAIITQGIGDWTIVQQVGGSADLTLEGYWVLPADQPNASAQVWARVVNEADSGDVLRWAPCEMLPDRQWRTTLRSIPTGGLYRVETSLQLNNDHRLEWARRGDMIRHVGVGDLWVFAGQSNAAGYGKGPIHDPPEWGIHMLRLNGEWDIASHPISESTDTRYIANREKYNPGHSPYLSFAKTLKRELGYPIGLIPAALAGSALRLWLPEEDGTLYRNMREIVRAAGNRIRGILWYQGESDAFYHSQYCDQDPEGDPDYLTRFAGLVSHWRRDFGDPALPVLTVQLNRYVGVRLPSERDHIAWGRVRDMQRQAAIDIPHVHVVPSHDGLMADEIHNGVATNVTIGQRLAAAALMRVYGKSVAGCAPNLIAAAYSERDGEHAITLHFEHVFGYFAVFGPHEPLFHAEDESGNLAVDSWSIADGSQIRLILNRKPSGTIKVHGCYEVNPPLIVPVDSVTYMPFLAFYGFPVNVEEAIG